MSKNPLWWRQTLSRQKWGPAVRRREHPDDFGVAFYYEDKTKDPERLWVRISRVEGNQCFGTLLMDSKHPDGLKEGDEIVFKVLQNENGDLEVVSVQK